MAEESKKLKLEVVPSTPSDAQDIEALWLDPGLGDGITDTHQDKIPIGKPRNFFRVHPEKQFRRRTEIYVHTPEGAMEDEYYIIAPTMRGKIQEARSSVIVPCIYRDGSLRLWPIPFPRSGEKDNSAWVSGRKAARAAIEKWIRLMWVAKSYQWREALKGYAPEPDWSKVPSLNEMLKLAVGPNGIIRDENHPIYRDLMGAPAKKVIDADADIGGDDGSDDDL